MAAAPLIEEVPEIVEAVGDVVHEVKDTATGFWRWFAHAAALTEEEDYRGLPAALGLAYTYGYPVVRDLRTFQLQLMGVADAAHKFFGGVGNAAEGGVKAVENAASLEQKVIGAIASVGGWL